jgi:uncharacterized protein Veg
VVGREVTLKTQPGVPGERRVQGVVASADDTTVVVRLSEPDADGAEERSLAYADIERARTVFRWGPTPAPKSPAKKPTATAPAVRTRKKAGAS